jgi:hypothetical protein
MFEPRQTDRPVSLNGRLAEWFKRWAVDLAVIAAASAVVVGGIAGLVVG